MLRVFTYSEAGGHVSNEGAFAVRAYPANERHLLVALGDGQGGRSGGGPASRLGCTAALDRASSLPAESLSNPDSWPDILTAADKAVDSDSEAGFTTLIGFAVGSDSIEGASSGDSAVLLINGGKAIELTRLQFKNPPVGSGEAIFIPFTADLSAPWAVLAMSDGVWKYVGWERVRDIAMRFRGQSLIDELQQAGRMRGSGKFQDDFTVVLIQDSE